MDYVDRTLQHWRRSRFEWGPSDCLTSLSDYWRGLSGIDIAARFRGTYSDEDGAWQAIRQYGDMLDVMELCGLPRTHLPKRGDMLLLDLEHALGALCTGHGAAARRIGSVLEVPLRLVKIKAAWSVPECLLSAQSSAQLSAV